MTLNQRFANQVSPPNTVVPALDLTGGQSRRVKERIITALLFVCGSLSVVTTVGIVVVLLVEALKFFGDASIIEFLTGTTWTGIFERDPLFGVLPLVAGTAMIALLAMAVAVPLGLMSAIYLSEYAPGKLRAILKPALELLAGIPTIVYGYFALTFITPTILKPMLPETEVYNALSAAIAVGIMVVPLIASLSEDAMQAVPRTLREAAYSVGATKLEVSVRIVVPAAFSGIVASVILAISRAIGETMIVSIASGARPNLSWNPLEGMQAMTGYIVQVVSGDVVAGSTQYLSLFAVGFLLFSMTLCMNIFSQWLVSRYREAYE